MPLTFIDIEKQKTWRIGLFFIVLLFLYFCVTYSLIQGIFFFVYPFFFFKTGSLSVLANPLYLFIVFGFSLLLATIHFWFSASDAVKSVIQNLGVIPPDPEDGREHVRPRASFVCWFARRRVERPRAGDLALPSRPRVQRKDVNHVIGVHHRRDQPIIASGRIPVYADMVLA